MSVPPQSTQATALLHEGWTHLKSERPLAAWACWRRALVVDPGSLPAGQALSTLGSAPDLPLAARMTYRLRPPADAARRAAWTQLMQDPKVEDAAKLAGLFGRLAAECPSDSAAWYNRALCLAWSGENREAVSCLDHVVSLDAERACEQAVSAWLLAEVLRQGGGAEELADDLRFACTIPWKPADTGWLLAEFPEIERVPTPQRPGTAPEEGKGVEVFEWLDRPKRGIDHRVLTAGELPIVLATVYIDRQSLRLSSPRALGLERIEELLLPRLEGGATSIRREASPLPLAFLDAAVWTFRMLPGVDSERSDQLRREAVERYFENEWVHPSRQGLGGLSPLGAARAARLGDAVARVKLAAVVCLREQLGARAAAVGLYQGYPFDRLRRRLGLALADPAAVDPLDLSCAPPEELDRLNPPDLDNARLAEAALSAAGLRDDERTARFVRELLSRQTREIAPADLTVVVSALVRQSMRSSDSDAALFWIGQAQPLGSGDTVKTLDVWRAEVLARSQQPKPALSVYLSLISTDPAGAVLALDAAETMLDNGHLPEARSLLFAARDLARSTGRRWVERRAQELLGGLA